MSTGGSAGGGPNLGQLGQMGVSITPQFKQFLAQLHNVHSQFVATARRMDATSKRLESSLSMSFGRMGGGLAASLAAFGSAAALGAAYRQVADLESRFADLRKVTGDTFEQIREDIKQLAAETRGVSIEDLVTLATEGRRLGVADEHLVRFTRHLGMLKVAVDDVPAEELATKTARILNVFGRSPTEAGRFGSALNKLSDNAAASAGEILDLTRRLSGSASTLRMTEAETLALATAMLEAGINVEVGGTAMGQVMAGMASNTEAFAWIAGQSLGQFTELLRTDALGAITAVQQGIQRFDQLGQFKMLKQLGLDGQRTTMTLLQLNRTIDRVPGHLAMANREWATMASLQKEAEVRGQTLHGRMQQLVNILKITGDTVAMEMAPVFDTFFSNSQSRLASMRQWVEDNRDRILEWSKAISDWGETFVDVMSQAAEGAGNLAATLNNIGEELDKIGKKAEASAEPGWLQRLAETLVWVADSSPTGFAAMTDPRFGGQMHGPVPGYEQFRAPHGGGEDPKPDAISPTTPEMPPIIPPDSEQVDADADALIAEREAAEELEAAYGRLFASLTDQAGRLRLGEEAWEDYTLGLQGATEAQIAQIRELREYIRAEEEAKRAREAGAEAIRKYEEQERAAAQAQRDAFTAMADEITEATRTPMERLRERLGELQFFASEGMIDPETFRRASAMAHADFRDETMPRRMSQASFVGAADLASKMQLDAFNNRADYEADIAANTGEMKGTLRHMAESHARLVEWMQRAPRWATVP